MNERPEPNERRTSTDAGVAPSPKSKSRKWMRRSVLGLGLALVVVVLSGCQTFSFYRQAIAGQYEIVAHQQKIEKVVADPRTPARLKAKLELVQGMRVFARDTLKLPVDGHYQKYVDVHRPYVVWNVEAAPEFSLEAKTWWYPWVGSLDYRGYFSEADATNYARILEEKGYDVFVGGVPAYSTLGWFKDPVLNTFVFDPEPDLAETIFHELGHQRVFASGDTHFNEAFATIVGQEGAKRWLRAKGDTNACARYVAELRRTDQFVHLVAKTRKELEALYGDERTDGGSIRTSKKETAMFPEELRQRKQQILAGLQKEYAQLKATEWEGDKGYDRWFAHGVNNAKLNSVAQYYDWLPAFRRLLELDGGDLERFYKAVEQLARQPKKERDAKLNSLAEGGVRAASREAATTAAPH